MKKVMLQFTTAKLFYTNTKQHEATRSNTKHQLSDIFLSYLFEHNNNNSF